jgi:hypothetical protein
MTFLHPGQELEALGMYGTLGKCAVVGRGEFDDNGNRYDAQVSRFAQVRNACVTRP